MRHATAVVTDSLVGVEENPGPGRVRRGRQVVDPGQGGGRVRRRGRQVVDPGQGRARRGRRGIGPERRRVRTARRH